MQETTTDHGRPTGSAIADLMAHVTALIRNEIDLARSEVSQNIRRAVTAVVLIVGALVAGLTALNVLAAALVAWIAESGLDEGWAALIVGGVLGIVAIALAAKGMNDLRASSLAPTRTVRNVRRDTAAATEATNGH